MKNLLLTIAASALCISAYAGIGHPTAQSFADYVSNVNQRALSSSRQWHKGGVSANAEKQQRIITQAEGSIGPVSSWGSLYTPDGEEWMYSADYTTELVSEWTQSITSAKFTIYNGDLEVYATFEAQFELGENESSINYVQIAPTLTRKFFNINDAYEVMLYVHATTFDYVGNSYNLVYTLSDGSLVTRVEGNNIDAVNTATDTWSEDFHMVFMREEFSETTDDEGVTTPSYMLYFDVYKKAGWGTGCTLEHTFEVDYELVSGAGNYAMPILINRNGRDLYYALPRYEKPYFANAWSEDINEDNHFIIDLYDKSFQLIKTTTIPMVLEEGALFSFPGMGELYGNRDLSFGVFNDNPMPTYIVGVENYVNISDDFTTSFYFYDVDGNRLATFTENALDYIAMTDIEGKEDQWCFYYADQEEGAYSYFRMINFPSGIVTADINTAIDDSSISDAIDRVAVGDSYMYVSSLTTGTVDAQDNVIHRIAWFKANGQFDHYDSINLGKDIALAMPYINAEALTPYLFNTDNRYEYMFLVKVYDDILTTTRTSEYFRIYNNESDMLLNMGPDVATGEHINTIFLFNAKSDTPKLIVAYYNYDTDQFSVRHIDLPFDKFSGGKGTLTDPYLLATPGDVMAIHTAPAAHFKVVDDIDFESTPWAGNTCDFRGSIDGNNHTFKNLSLYDNGIISYMTDGASVSDLKLENVTVSFSSYGSMGVIADETASNGTTAPLFSNITINGLEVSGNGGGNFGGIVGRAAIGTKVSLCSVIDTDIDLPNATVGGVYGMMTTGSVVEASVVQGSVKGEIAGGFVGSSLTGDEIITNCHSLADVKASEIAGGIIGQSGRSNINHCFVEGSAVSDGSYESYAGGVAGYLNPTFETDAPIAISENIVACSKISANTSANRWAAHRIVGFSSIDDRQVDWESTDPNVDWSDPSTYPYLPGVAEKFIKNNYAFGIARIDSDVADDADSTEGKTMTGSQLSLDFLTSHGWAFGSTPEAPWKEGGALIKLFFEPGSYEGIQSVAANAAGTISFDGQHLCADGVIEVYNTSGMCVARGFDSLSVSQLPKGVYVARSANATLKFAH